MKSILHHTENKDIFSKIYPLRSNDFTTGGQFNVYSWNTFNGRTAWPSRRRDFYKIALLIEGEGILSYTDKTIRIKNNTLTFANPAVPYSWEPTSTEQTGFFCVFTEDFINGSQESESLGHSPLFNADGNHNYFPDEEAMHFLRDVFSKMLRDIASGYPNKYDLLRNYVRIIMHEALKLQPADSFHQHSNAAARISSQFFELLERQFPIDAVQRKIALKSAKDFAGELSIHVNHLNRVLKENTGRSTSELIAHRITKEARALLLHTDWEIAEIAHCLGFEHSSNFHLFFKKQTLRTPGQFRRQVTAQPVYFT